MCMNLKVCGRTWWWPNLRYYLRISFYMDLGKPRRTTDNQLGLTFESASREPQSKRVREPEVSGIPVSFLWCRSSVTVQNWPKFHKSALHANIWKETFPFLSGRILYDIPCKVCQDHSSGKHYGIFACDGWVPAARCFAFVSLCCFNLYVKWYCFDLSQLCGVLQEVHQEAEAICLQSQVGRQLRGGQDAP